MDSVGLTVQTLDVINSILHDIIGYGGDRKVNFTIGLSKTGMDINMDLTYNDTGELIFFGTIKQDKFIEAIKNEDKKEKERDKN